MPPQREPTIPLVETDPRAGGCPFPKPRALVLSVVKIGKAKPDGLRRIDTADSDLIHHQYRLSVLQWNTGPPRRNPSGVGKPADWENHRSFILLLQPLGRWEERRRQESHVSEGVEPGFIGHAYDQNERPREGKDKWQEGVKSNFRTSRIVLVKYMSSVCALTEDIYKILKFDKQHPILASIQCHSNTTISVAILAPTLPARLLQCPNVTSLASSPGRKKNLSRSQRVWFFPQNVMSSSPPSWVWSTLKNFTVKCSKGGVAFRGADVARLLQHLLGEDEAESGASLQSLWSTLSPFLDSTSQTMSITALPAVLQHLCLITLTHHQCEEFWQLFTVESQGCLQCS